MMQIKHHQVCICHIQAQLKLAGKTTDKDIATSLEAHHVIGISQNFPEHICVFLRKNERDPAVKVTCLPFFHLDILFIIYPQGFIPKLKKHILPCIKEMLHQEASAGGEGSNYLQAGLSTIKRTGTDDNTSLFFKSDHMYCHNLAQFNYTTYDIQRSQEVINPSTSHCNIMLLANTGNDDGSNHHFLYACVLGIYHVHVVYTGDGSLDYTAWRVEFLWVRWFEYDQNKPIVWTDLKLDPVRFLPMTEEGAFGFVDPKDVLCGCHVVPAFVRGKA
jgi:hypothetical protein